MTAISTRLATLADLEAIASLFDAYRQFYGQALDLPAASGFIRHRLEKGDPVILLASASCTRSSVPSRRSPFICSLTCMWFLKQGDWALEQHCC